MIGSNSSALEIAKFLDQEKDIDQSWRPRGYLSYPRLIRNLETFLYAKARQNLPSYRYERIRIHINMDRNNGMLTVDIEERQPRLKWKQETSLMKRPTSAMVLWVAFKRKIKTWIDQII